MNAVIRSSAILGLLAAALLSGCERPPVDTVQRGYRGVQMVHVSNPRIAAQKMEINAIPDVVPAAEPGSPNVKTVYKNVQVLGDLSVNEFTRLMIAMSAWVSPQQGCAYCHAGADFAADTLYTKVVARRMLQMTKHINTDWQQHVAQTGVTCYTCHRGQPIPKQVWYSDPRGQEYFAHGALGNNAGQNLGAKTVGLTSLPLDPFTPFLENKTEIRVVSNTEVPYINRHSIKQTEWTYGLMMHMSDSLGVNCTYCHNSRSFISWDQSTPQRTTAWYGIRMVRDLNTAYLDPLKATYPKERLGPLGDPPKANCGTCHNGAFKPLYGQSMLKDYPELAAAVHAQVPPAASSQK